MTRQNYYKRRGRRGRREVDEELVVSLVCQERKVQPCLGGRKLFHLVQAELAEAGVRMGRDRFFDVLRGRRLLIERSRRGVRTTDSRHSFRVYGNLLKELALVRPHQALVSDITYIRTDEGFLYLCLVMDAFSRAIVGFDCSDSLEREGAMRALAQALAQLPSGNVAIHHSDRGSQYCCQDYVALLEAAHVSISMTQENHCYENGRAERLNGILKQEYGLGGGFGSKSWAQAAVAQAVALYNYRRPHQALGYAVPMAVHQVAVA
jgi:transposase InsO family protein